MLTSWLIVLACVAIHELGHAAAAWFCGVEVKDIVIFGLRPHVTFAGSLTRSSGELITVAGTGAVLCVWLLWMLLFSHAEDGEELPFVTAAICMHQSLVWVVCGVLYTVFPNPDPSLLVLRYGWSPITVFLTGALMCLLVAWVARRRQPSLSWTGIWPWLVPWSLLFS